MTVAGGSAFRAHRAGGGFCYSRVVIKAKDQKLIASANQPPAAISRRDAILLGGLGLVACLVAADIFLSWWGNGDRPASEPLLKPAKPLAEVPNSVAAPKLDEAPGEKANSEPAPITKHKEIYDRVANEGQGQEYIPPSEVPANMELQKPEPTVEAKPQKKQIDDRVPQ